MVLFCDRSHELKYRCDRLQSVGKPERHNFARFHWLCQFSVTINRELAHCSQCRIAETSDAQPPSIAPNVEVLPNHYG
jgi:hypothetical protein